MQKRWWWLIEEELTPDVSFVWSPWRTKAVTARQMRTKDLSYEAVISENEGIDHLESNRENKKR